MEWPPEWSIFPAEDFNTASPRIGGLYAAELLAQIKPNGRILDHWRISIGGTSFFQAEFKLSKVFNFSNADKILAKAQFLPRDIEIRRNMTTSAWFSLNKLLEARDAAVLNSEGEELPTDQVLTAISEGPTSTVRDASFRWAVVIGADGSLQLDLQSLPASTDTLNSKPAFLG